MIWWLIFEHKADLHGARIDSDNPLDVQVHWNGAKPREKRLQREYTPDMIKSLSPQAIQQGLFQMAGHEAGNIKKITIHEGELEWTKYFKERMR